MVILLLITHGKVTRVARKQQMQIQAIDVSESGQTVRKGKKMDRATAMLLVMVGVYLTLWFPFVLSSVNFIIYAVGEQKVSPRLQIVAYL